MLPFFLFTRMNIGFQQNVEWDHFRQCFPAAVRSGHVFTFLPPALGYLTQFSHSLTKAEPESACVAYFLRTSDPRAFLLMDARGIAELVSITVSNSRKTLQCGDFGKPENLPRNNKPAQAHPSPWRTRYGFFDLAGCSMQRRGERMKNSCSCSRQLALAKGTPCFRVPGGSRGLPKRHQSGASSLDLEIQCLRSVPRKIRRQRLDS